MIQRILAIHPCRDAVVLLSTRLLFCAGHASAQVAQKVVDIPMRAGVTQRMVVLFAGGHGGLHIFPNGSFNWGEGNFLVRSRQLFADQGLLVAVVDAPSDRQSAPFLGGFRQREYQANVPSMASAAVLNSGRYSSALSSGILDTGA